jgi:phenylacetate-coenzyme A ligase PaaK-like adenylate-forming protein
VLERLPGSARGWRTDLCDADALLERQQRNIRRMVQHAYSTVPFYSEAMKRRGLTAADIRTADDLGSCPW